MSRKVLQAKFPLIWNELFRMQCSYDTGISHCLDNYFRERHNLCIKICTDANGQYYHCVCLGDERITQERPLFPTSRRAWHHAFNVSCIFIEDKLRERDRFGVN